MSVALIDGQQSDVFLKDVDLFSYQRTSSNLGTSTYVFCPFENFTSLIAITLQELAIEEARIDVDVEGSSL